MSEKLLRQAIRDRRVVEFRYHGEHRTVEPYRLGLDGGRLRLMGWQARKGWRSFYADEMEELELSERSFLQPREGYTRGDSAMDRILAEV
jgi:predicted DNA-binding transcriptional regulator YafY